MPIVRTLIAVFAAIWIGWVAVPVSFMFVATGMDSLEEGAAFSVFVGFQTGVAALVALLLALFGRPRAGGLTVLAAAVLLTIEHLIALS